ncbi:Holliday junction branch migration DNA helicase RuvB [Ureaplasma urealyticum]|uniref:Holliday junction branch migration DNA helicase RuvB n=1 Tax=Ureaplasma urealyticum TaxID=2130 RepID=UPI0002F0385D|nr:Holliday junction branch migration DNA helicase RuvB [Ureaplasma urealyticum]
MKTNNEFRPQYLKDFIGKDQLKSNLKIYLNATKRLKSSFDHTLLHGLAGTGKTTLATIIANEMGVDCHMTQGNLLNKPVDIINLLSLIKENDVIFVDEIHACGLVAFETLYSVLEDFCIDISIGKDFNAKMTRLKVPHFTLIGATTMLGKIPKPLEERFGHVFYLSEYETSEIAAIILKNNQIHFQINLNDQEIDLIANSAKGIPRLANRLLKRVVDFKINGFDNIKNIFEKIQIYDFGLEEQDINYLNVLYQQENEIGLKSIAQILRLDQYTIETKIEPYLIQHHFINKNLRGRKITAKGIEFLKNNQLIK